MSADERIDRAVREITIAVENDNPAAGVGVAEAMWAVGAKVRGELSPDAYEALFRNARDRMDAIIPPRPLVQR